MARAIDSEAAYRFLSEQLVKETGAFSKGVNKGLNIARSAMRNPDAIPTLTPPNEWVSVETPPTTQGWYHVAVLDLKTGKYTVEQDLYSIELAKAHSFEPGFCKANRWEERERIDYWCRFPTPPDCRPPEGEEDKYEID